MISEVTKITPLLNSLDQLLEAHKAQVKQYGSAKLVLERSQHNISRKNFSAHALSVLEGLSRAGYEAYLVGGCIRDLLSGKTPKDYDVSTNATPEQIRRVFQNSRIIGRRFKIVHVVFGRDIIEVTTFRGNQEPVHENSRRAADRHSRFGTRISDDSGMLVRDNVYGRDISEDSDRRDFTINAIYYDIKTFELLDFHAGIYDLKHGIIDVIGDPEQRYSEDPVRMIRALRFAAKLGFEISKRTAEPIGRMADTLKQVSNARMFEEVNKLFLTGHGLQSFRILRKYHLFEVLFPQLKEHLLNPVYTDFIEYALKSSDDRFLENKPNMPHFLYAIILWPRFQDEVFRLQQLNDSLVSPISTRDIAAQAFYTVRDLQMPMTAIPAGIAESMRSMWTLQLALISPDDENVIKSVTAQSLFRGAFDIFKLRARFEPYLKSCVEMWRPYYDESSARHRYRQEKEQFRENNQGLEKETQKVVYDEVFEEDSSKERNDRLARARAWRAAMHLDP